MLIGNKNRCHFLKISKNSTKTIARESITEAVKQADVKQNCSEICSEFPQQDLKGTTYLTKL